jgi:hypothetical protein
MPLFRSKNDIAYLRRQNKEVVERVIGEKITYYAISNKFTKKNFYNEALEKVFDAPVEVFALVKWKDQQGTTTKFGQDLIYNISFYPLLSTLAELNLSPREGDFVEYDMKRFEITLITYPKQMLGKEEENFYLQLDCTTARDSTFHTHVSGTADDALNTRPDAQLSSSFRYSDVTFPYVTSIGTAPAVTISPSLSGISFVGSTLTTNNGTWTGNGTISYTYQWRRDGVNISGSTNSSYVLTQTDANTEISVVITATNSYGSASTVSNGASIPSDIAGNWIDTYYYDGTLGGDGATTIVNNGGGNYSGTEDFEGTISLFTGTLVGRVWSGTWLIEDTVFGGTFSFTFAPDGNSWTGTYEDGAITSDWNGVRA